MITPRDRFMNYMFGFYAGAGCKTIDKKRSEHTDESMRDAYGDGWRDGKNASRRAAEFAESFYGYKPSVIRCADGGDTV